MTSHQCQVDSGCGAPATIRFVALHARDLQADAEGRKGCVRIERWACGSHYSAFVLQAAMVLTTINREKPFCPRCGGRLRIVTDMVDITAVQQRARK